MINDKFDIWYDLGKAIDQLSEHLAEVLEDSKTKDFSLMGLQQCRMFAHLNIMRDKDKIYHSKDIYRNPDEQILPPSKKGQQQDTFKQTPPPIKQQPQEEDIPFPEVEQSRQPQQVQYEEDDDELPF
jgi:hypothetical protein